MARKRNGRPLSGLFAGLTPEQQADALTYRGDDHFGDPEGPKADRTCDEANTKLCVVCGAGIKHQHHNAKTCSSGCRKERAREIGKKWMREWRKENPDRNKANSAKCRKRRKELYPEKVKAEARSRNALRYKKDPLPYLERAKRWSAKNPEKRRQIARRYAERRNAALKLIRELEAKGLEALL